MRFYLGIDPGYTGALAFYDPANGDLSVFDMPVHQYQVGGKNRTRVNMHELARIIDSLVENTLTAVVEEVSPMPKQGITSAGNFMFAAACVQQAVVSAALPLKTVRPAVWKKAMGLTSDKSASRREASRLMPRHDGLWPLIKHDGRAEAALLAYYIAHNGGQNDPFN